MQVLGLEKNSPSGIGARYDRIGHRCNGRVGPEKV